MSVDSAIENPGSGLPPPSRGEAIAAGLRNLAALAGSGIAGRELREQLVEQASRFFAADAVALWRLETRDRIWRIAMASGLSTDYSSVAIAAPDQYDTGAVLASPLFIADVHSWPLVDERQGLYDNEGIASFLVIPLMIRGDAAGTICCYYRTHGQSCRQLACRRGRFRRNQFDLPFERTVRPPRRRRARRGRAARSRRGRAAHYRCSHVAHRRAFWRVLLQRDTR